MIILSSCKAKFYKPNHNPVPLFKNKGDIYVDASTDLAQKFDATAGYAITNGLGAYVGYGGARSSNTYDSASNIKVRYEGDMLNLGLGYFLSQNQSSQFRFELFADLGLGSYKNTTSGFKDKYYLNGNYRRIGIMPNIGFTSLDNRFCFAYSMRLSNIAFYNTSVGNYSYWQYDIDRLNKKSSYNLLEHSMNVRFGSKNVKFQAQFALYHRMDAYTIDNAIPTFNMSVMFGVVLNMNAFGNL